METLGGQYAFIADKVEWSSNLILSNLGVPS